MLFSIHIHTNGLTNSRAVLRTLRELYGNGYKPNEFIDEYYWWGKKATVNYDENSIDGDADISMWSEILSKQKKEYEKEQAKESKKDF